MHKVMFHEMKLQKTYIQITFDIIHNIYDCIDIEIEIDISNRIFSNLLLSRNIVLFKIEIK